MRIVAGEWRGRKISAPPEESAAIRPTSDRAREAIFNILFSNHGLPDGARVLDLCCGTGALGLEALSRGAVHGTFIDHSGDALRLVKTTLETFKAPERGHMILAALGNLPAAATPCDLVFLDPPYRKNLVSDALAELQAKGWLAPHALVVIETSKEEVVELPAGFTLTDTRKYGIAQVLFVEKDDNGAAERT